MVPACDRSCDGLIVLKGKGLMRIGIGSDVIGVQLREQITLALSDGFEVVDYGVDGAADDEQCPYPIIGWKVAQAVASGDVDRGILICGTGIGMAITANKVKGVRAAVPLDPYSIERSVLSNNCNVLCLGSRVVGVELARRIVSTWLALQFDPRSASAKKVMLLAELEGRREEARVK